MKKVLSAIFLNLILFFLSSLLLKNSVIAQETVNCSGHVENTGGIPIEGVEIRIYINYGLPQGDVSVHPCAGCGWAQPCPSDFNDPDSCALQYLDYVATTTDSGGDWIYPCACWPNHWEITRIEFAHSSYPTQVWQNTQSGYFCTTGTVVMQLDGWSCNTSTGVCEPQLGGTYADENLCNVNCSQYGFRCVTSSVCGRCTAADDPSDCPYTDSSCNGMCTGSSTITPGTTPGTTGGAVSTLAPVITPGGEHGTCGNNAIYTAIGCIPINSMNEFTGDILSWAIGIAGGVAFIMIIVSGYIITSAAGDPKRLQGGKELLTAAVSGLLLLVFSVFLLHLIGVEILNLPGLSP